MQIVDAFEALGAHCFEQWRDAPGGRIEHLDAALVVGDEGAAVLVHLHPVRPAVVFRHLLPVASRRDPEDAPMRNVGNEQISLSVEAGPLEETVDRLALMVVRPGRTHLLAELVWQAGENLGLDRHGRRIEAHIGSPGVSGMRPGHCPLSQACFIRQHEFARASVSSRRHRNQSR